MDMGSSLDQGPSAGSGDDQNGSSRNDAAEAAAESNRVITGYNVTPDVARNARSFMRVRRPRLSPFHFLTDAQLRPRTQLLHLHLAIQEIRSTVSTLAQPDGYGLSMPSALEVRHPSLRQHTPADVFGFRRMSRSTLRFSSPSLQSKRTELVLL